MPDDPGYFDVEIPKGDFAKLKELLNRMIISQSVYEHLLSKVSEKDNVLRLVRTERGTDCVFDEDC